MKKLKLAAVALFAVMAFACEESFAQSQNDQSQPTTDPNATAQPPVDASQNQNAGQGTDPNVSSEPSNVTIDSTSAAGSSSGSSVPSTTPASGSESGTKIHIYSGKHSGNNVINPDPKN